MGELARRTGLTVRSLHRYDEIRLLTPSYRTGSGHRLYTADDVTRLQMIVSRRQLGLSLKDIGVWPDRPGTTAGSVLDLHLSRLRERIEAQQALYRGSITFPAETPRTVPEP
ncbi:MAG TPA: transcriptional regulator, partial [Acidobacteria bacterium]|nr:transcriptional regulator [Acidobacteriota bacterium]